MKGVLQGWLGWALGAVIAGVLIVVGIVMIGDFGKDAPGPAAPPTTEEQAAAPASAADPVEPAPQEPLAPDAFPPAFDVVRVAPDGAAVIAGHAAPGAEVSVLVEGAAMAAARADAAGNFVAMFDIPLSDTPRVMQLSARIGPGAPLLSEASVIVEPRVAAAPAEQVAAAPEAQDPVMEPPVSESPAMESAEPDSPVSESPAAEAPAALAEVAPEAPASPEATAPIVAMAEPAPRVLRADREGIIVMEAPGEARVEAALALDAVAYDAAGEVIVSGRGPAGQRVRLYLDNAAVGEAAIGGDGQWRLTLPDSVRPGIYTLRVDGLGPDGAVTARIESPFKREAREDLLASAPAAPAPPAAPGAGQEPSPEAPAPGDPAAQVPVAPEPPAAPAPVPAAAPDAAPAVSVVTVQPGSSLWAIARDRYGEGVLYVRVFEANRDKIRDPDLIYPGQVFHLPEGDPAR